MCFKDHFGPTKDICPKSQGPYTQPGLKRGRESQYKVPGPRGLDGAHHADEPDSVAAFHPPLFTFLLPLGERV